MFDVPVSQVQQLLGAGREKLVEIPQLQPLRLDTVVHMPVVCNDSCRMVQTRENCEGPRSCSTSERPCCAGLLAQFIDKILTVWRLWRWDGFFGGFSAFFALLRVSRSGAPVFRALDDEEFFVVEGSPGWRGRRKSNSQVTCQRMHNSFSNDVDKAHC